MFKPDNFSNDFMTLLHFYTWAFTAHCMIWTHTQVTKIKLHYASVEFHVPKMAMWCWTQTQVSPSPTNSATIEHNRKCALILVLYWCDYTGTATPQYGCYNAFSHITISTFIATGKPQHHSISIHCCIATSCTYYVTLWLKTHYSINNKIKSGTNQHISIPYNVPALKSHLQGEGLISVKVTKVMNQLYPTPNEAACYTLLKNV